MYKVYDQQQLSKISELSTTDLKAIYDYAAIMKYNWENVGGHDVDIDEAEEMVEYWDHIIGATNLILEQRIKQIFKP